MLATYLLVYNPDRWVWPDNEYAEAVRITAAGDVWPGRWSVGSRRHGISPGDRAFLMRQKRDRGLIASGHFTSDIYEAEHFDGSPGLIPYADIEWDILLPIEDRLTVEDLKMEVPGVAWDRLQGSGVAVQPAEESGLETAWGAHVPQAPYRSPEEPSGGTFPEGSLVRIEVNRYERDRRARARCIAHYGTDCAACGVNFEQQYGPMGRGFIHVHHLKDLSTCGPGYEVDPKADLRPVCPNCHSMLHTTRPAMSIKALKGHLKRHAGR